MPVPNTNTFSLSDVGNEIGLTAPYSLQDCFNNAKASGFDPTYEGSKNSLYNFRNYDHKLRAVYGYLYNYYAYSHTSFAPSGWHVPTQSEWNALSAYLGGDSVVGGKLKETGTDHWLSPNTGADNSSGFTLLGAGGRAENGLFGNLKYTANNASLNNGPGAIYVLYNSATISTSYPGYTGGSPVRLVKDNSINPGTIADYDGNTYDCITIGSQVWLLQNWKCSKLNNGTLIPTVTLSSSWAGLSTPGKCAYNNDENNV